MVERIEIAKGLNVPLAGSPSIQVDTKETSRVGLVGADYIGMRPTMLVSEGDAVEAGQPLFEDKKTPGLLFTAPVAGKVVEVNRGEKRTFQTVVIEREGEGSRKFNSFDVNQLGSLDRQQLVDQLVASGLWTSLRVGPSVSALSESQPPHSIFVNAMDTSRWRLPRSYIEQRREFTAGLANRP